MAPILTWLKMIKNIIFKLLISFFIISPAFAYGGKEEGFVSISPAMTEIMYALGAQNQLKAVSDRCNYPDNVKFKEKIGSGYLLNDEKIIKLNPKYILALDSSGASLKKFEKFNIIPLCFSYKNIEEVLSNIKKIGKLTDKNKQANLLIQTINTKIAAANKGHGTKILFLVQTNPIITIGKKSFIADFIQKSGNICVSCSLNMSYPQVNEEYLIKQKPDVIILSPFDDDKRVRKLFPNTKMVRLKKSELDVMIRPGPRVYKAVEYFARF